MTESRKSFYFWRFFGCFYAASMIFLIRSKAQAFVGVSRRTTASTTRRTPISIPSGSATSLNQLLSRKDKDRDKNSIHKEEPKKKSGYKFGDFTKSLVNSVTGKEEYHFGDLTVWVGGKVGQTITGQDSYEFGDVTRSMLQNYTGKSTYEFGDLSKSVIQRVQSGEYDPWDVFLALRVLLAAGFTVFTPVATLLPIRLLLQLVNLGLAQEVSGRVVTVLAEHLDRRMKQAFTGNAQYALGDITKERLEQGLAKFTGKETYEIGDVAKAVQRIQKEALASGSNNKKNEISLASDVLSALEMLDSRGSKSK